MGLCVCCTKTSLFSAELFNLINYTNYKSPVTKLAYSLLTLPNFKFPSLYFEFRRRYFTQKVPLSYPKNGTFHPKKWHFSTRKMALFNPKNGTFWPNKWHFLTINKKSNFENKKSNFRIKKSKSSLIRLLFWISLLLFLEFDSTKM